MLGRTVDAFAWVGGEEESYSVDGLRAIRSAGFCYAFGTNNVPLRQWGDALWIERTNLEASYSLDLVGFQLSGLMDLAYRRKRRRLRTALADEPL